MNVYLRKRQFRWQKVAITAAILIATVATLDFFQQPVKNALYYATNPVVRIFWKAGSTGSGLLSSFLKIPSLSQENSNIKEENEKLLKKVYALQEIIAQNQAMEEAAENPVNGGFDLVLAQPAGLEGEILSINRGRKDGIQKNMPVISGTGVLFGKVSEVFDGFAHVTLISSPQSVVDAKIPPRSGIPSAEQSQEPSAPPITGAVKGSGGFSLYLDLVSSEAQIMQHDTVITSGQEGTFPSGLLIGKISSVTKNDLQPFQSAKLEPFFNISTVQNLFIITNYKRQS